jgi:hypothetical protein
MRSSATPEQALRARLANTSHHGTFESHVTTETADAAGRQRFRDVCRSLGVKCVFIELPDGTTPSQPMTACYHHGAIGQVLGEVAAICHGLRAAGFPITRVKLEAIATNEGIPDSDEEAARAPAGDYFEFHVKLLLAPDADLGALASCCGRHAARLSRNALKTERDGRAERFVTLRLYGVGRRTAFARLDALERDLGAAGFAVVNRQREYTIFDSAESLDAGWIDPPPSSEAGS